MEYYVAFVGFAMMILITILLIKKKINVLFAFAIIPILGAVLIGCKPADIGSYVETGLGKTTELMLIMFFSLPYFSVMSDAGMFDIMVDWLLKHTKLSCVAVTVVTVFVSIITELDGSVTSTFLVTIPMMLPLYKRLKMNPKILVFLCSATMCSLFVTPWNSRALRAATLLEGFSSPQNYIFTNLAPMMFIYIGFCLVMAVFLAKREEKRGAGLTSDAGGSVEIKLTELSRPKLFWFNVILTVGVIMGLSFAPVTDYFVFAVGLVIALMVNYPDLKLQEKLLKNYAQGLYPIAAAVLLAGVVVGVLQESGMVDAMVSVLVSVIPTALGPYIYLIVALFSTPLMLIFTNDVWQYALVPIIIGVSQAYGVPTEVVVFTLIMNIGAMLSPVAQPQLYLACDLGEIEMGDYVKYSFKKMWLLSILWTVTGFVLGIFR